MTRNKEMRLYFERQCKQDCVVHSYNNMMGGRILTPMMLVKHYRTHRERFPDDSVKTWFKTNRRNSGTFFHTYLFRDWFKEQHPGLELTEVDAEYRSNNSRRLFKQIDELLSDSPMPDRFILVFYEHIAAVRKIDGQWNVGDSEGEGWCEVLPLDKRWSSLYSIFIVTRIML